MLRIFLTVLLPIALPLIAYIIYVKTTRVRPSALAVSIILGVSVALLAAMLSLEFSRGVPPGTKLISPHLENGEVIPSQRLDEAQ